MSIFEIVGTPEVESPLVLTCEHADNVLPEGIEPAERERQWLEEHWGWDIGAADLVRAMAEMEDGTAVLSRYSRLMCDPNRALHEDDLIRTHVGDEPITFNQNLSREEVRGRIERYHEPYHEAVDRHLEAQVERNPDLFLVSVHTFTPILRNERRGMEIGLLFDHDQPYATSFVDPIREVGFDVALNEPYSGLDGMIYSVKRHGTNHRVRHLEIEVRNDLVATRSGAESVAARLVEAFGMVPWYGV